MYPFPMDCTQTMKNGNMKSGIYTIYINNDNSKPMEVYCDMETDGGGWLVLYRNKPSLLNHITYTVYRLTALLNGVLSSHVIVGTSCFMHISHVL